MKSELKFASQSALEEYARRGDFGAKEVEVEKIRRNLFTKSKLHICYLIY